MINILYVFIGGGIGCLSRYWFLKIFANENISSKLPSYINYVLAVNVVGSFLIGLLFALLKKANFTANIEVFLKFFVIIGFLGGFTTFSSFSIDILSFLERGQVLNALIFVFISIFLGILAVYAGFTIGKYA